MRSTFILLLHALFLCPGTMYKRQNLDNFAWKGQSHEIYYFKFFITLHSSLLVPLEVDEGIFFYGFSQTLNLCHSLNRDNHRKNSSIIVTLILYQWMTFVSCLKYFLNPRCTCWIYRDANTGESTLNKKSCLVIQKIKNGQYYVWVFHFPFIPHWRNAYKSQR